MRFSYDPVNGEISAYVRRDEFELAARGDEYRVFSRQFDRENLQTFIEQFCVFVKQVFTHLFPDEQVRDIVTVSTYKSGYAWTSLLNFEVSDENPTFLETLMGYALHVIEQQATDGDPEKRLVDYISPEDAAKLSLLMTIMSLTNLPPPFKKRKRKVNQLKNRLKIVDKKLAEFEERFKFTSEEMYKYYQDDELPDEDMSDWITLYEEKLFIQSIQARETLANELVDKWAESM